MTKDEQDLRSAQAAALYALASDITNEPVEAIMALQAALGAMIATHAKDGRTSAMSVCKLVSQSLRDGTEKHFDRQEATLQ